MGREFHYRWEFDLRSSPEQLWPLVADTNRFNRDTGVPSVEAVGAASENARRRMRLTTFGVPIEWEEQPFEWVRPQRFGVVRRYFKGPIEELRVQAELTPVESGADQGDGGSRRTGTKLTYEVRARAKNFLGALAIPVQIGLISARRFARAFREYDQMAVGETAATPPAADVEFSPGGRSRLLELGERLVVSGCDENTVGLLVEHLENADDLALARIRPYQLARQWQRSRRDVLGLCLQATRAGMLDLQWNLICPMCRGGEARDSLNELSGAVHCNGCNIDFTVNFEQSVELTFRPNPSIREVDVETFCIGGPQVTPHIVAQQLLTPGSQRSLNIRLEDGRYRLRTMALPGFQQLRATSSGPCGIVVRGSTEGWGTDEIEISTACNLRLENATGDEQLFIFERTQWSDDAATAAEVTSLQTFRDLFASEALRPGEQISVGTLTVLFTDLKDSTRLYREIGDATAFGRVMNHFDVLKQTIAAENGALVKTIGDAVMAVFRRPAGALRAMLEAQELLANPPVGMLPLTLKAGLHTGPCIAVTLNDRLDYFGSTVNLAARLEGQSTGGDVVISSIVYSDPEVRELLSECPAGLSATPFMMPLKGFDEQFELWRIARGKAEESGSVPRAVATGSDVRPEH